MLEKISSKGTETVVDDALTVSSWTDASLAGETAVIYLLIASHSDGRKQELARMELDIDSPSSYLLASAFPNPAVSMANFKYFLSVEGLVSIALYDPSGRLLEEWNQGFLDADAWYSVKTDVSHLASGLYFFRIQVEGFSDTVFDKTQAFHVVN
ncbi:MAG: T9SS type A sorting domain-containing protein [Bacteroidetes Order II. Incertae sedis bacterium]|nr:T9SS type A sorting domain-containing protein [Bacteroidetes Order II. bacterium]